MVEAKIKALRDELERHNYNYYVLSAPTISDFEFDKMMKELQELEAAHPEFADPDSPTRRVGSDLSKEFEQVVHKYPMLSLGNTYSEDEIRDFYDRTVRSLNEPFEIVAELKYDGTSISLTYEKGRLTRAVPSSCTLLGWFRLSPIDQYSSLLPPVGVWTVSQFQCGGPSSQNPY